MKIEPSESQIQMSIVEYLSLMAHRYGFIFFSIVNEAYGIGKGKGALTGQEYGQIAKLKKMGLTAGVADLEIVHKGRAYFLEVKRPGQTQSDAQKLFMQNAYNVGAEYAVVRSVDQVIESLELWGIM